MFEKPSTSSVKYNQAKYSPISEKSIQSSHYLQEVTSFETHPYCHHHAHDYISHMCLNCNYQCLCGTCLKQGNHKTHNIKNIEKSVKVVDRMLGQFAIRIRSKSEILDHLNQSLSIQKSEIYQQLCQYKKMIEDKFSALLQIISIRQQEILSQLKAQQQSYFHKIDICAKLVSEQSKSSINLIEIISQIQKLQPTSKCIFFSNRKSIIEEAIRQQKISSLKSSIPEIKICFNPSEFDDLYDKIRFLEVFDSPKILRSTSPKRMIKKSIKHLAKTVVRNQKPRDSFPVVESETPKEHKGGDSHKDLTKFFRSPNSKNLKRGISSGKLLSMPASPEKQKLSKNPSPSRDQFKKKVRKNKK